MVAPLLVAVMVLQGSASVSSDRLDTSPGRRPVAQAVRTRVLPSLDGRLDDPAWNEAIPLTSFIQRTPFPGRPASEATEARVLFSDAALYVGIRAFDTQPDQITGRLTRRDERSDSDWVGVHIDAYRDRRTAYQFAVNAAGVKLDIFRFNDIEEDLSWDAVWEAKVFRDSAGWSAEFRIPFTQMRLASGDQPLIGFNIHRRINRTNEVVDFSPIPPGGTAFVSTYGDLAGLQDIRPPQAREVQPYVLLGEVMRRAESGNPFRPAQDFTGTAGADFRLGITSGLTLTGALNPDFGQVESDPATVNLTAFETFLAERRPLFTEGADAFRFAIATNRDGPEQLFYSRRIGRAPQGEVDERGGFAQEIGSTRILAAAKLTGRPSPGWSLGVLAAMTREEEAEVVDSLGRRHQDVIEPRTAYLAGRLNRNLREGRTSLGVFGTAVHRSLTGEVAHLRSGAYTLSGEIRHRFLGDRYRLRAWLAASRVEGSAEALDSTQRSGVHYFQRPDDHGSVYDSTRTSLTGLAGQLDLGKENGNWLWAVTATGRTPGFEANDLGFHFWSGRIWEQASITRRWLTPGKVFRSADVRLAQFGFWTSAGQRINGGTNLVSNFILANQWTGNLQFWLRAGGLDPAALRGGPALRLPGNWYSTGTLLTDGRRPVQFGLGFDTWYYPGIDFWGVEVSPTVHWRPATNQEFQIGARFENLAEDRQFIESARLGNGDEYLVGRLRQTTAALTLRANRTFSPTLSLQLYAEPFVSIGRYTGYRRVLDPAAYAQGDQFDELGSDRVTVAGELLSADLDGDGVIDLETDRPDFTIVSLQANLVARWEFLPGSTLFLVWQHRRSDDLVRGDLGVGEGWRMIGNAAAENTLQLKVSYRISN
jgi:hypothetical protein